jgi:hypothetical protein
MAAAKWQAGIGRLARRIPGLASRAGMADADAVMTRLLFLTLLISWTGFGLVSCANKDPDPRPAVGPTSETSRMPWNVPHAGHGQGQFGMLPQNQYRR